MDENHNDVSNLCLLDYYAFHLSRLCSNGFTYKFWNFSNFPGVSQNSKLQNSSQLLAIPETFNGNIISNSVHAHFNKYKKNVCFEIKRDRHLYKASKSTSAEPDESNCRNQIMSCNSSAPSNTKPSFTIENILGKANAENSTVFDAFKHKFDNSTILIQDVSVKDNQLVTAERSNQNTIKLQTNLPSTTSSPNFFELSNSNIQSKTSDTMSKSKTTWKSMLTNPFETTTLETSSMSLLNSTKQTANVTTTTAPTTHEINNTTNDMPNNPSNETDVTSSTMDSPLVALYSMTNQTLPGQILFDFIKYSHLITICVKHLFQIK
ncbi:hypothetical protein HELRODRAFT_161156 [Helobdella robusta]|uniref:Uncharacterized protein n=1 Tax=Helobdella robusta TaxID=6412 RepID=T1ER59_HELRO|nr:hypothetical protein HELRODRAFT_161156 [Helobdella robusta]ESO01949.1 hypothetical protein HELRODRAFT_161156 [Helobdella robusta]